MYMVWHVDKYKITFKLVINWTKEILEHIEVSSGLSRPGIIEARARYRAATRRFRNTDLTLPQRLGFQPGEGQSVCSLKQFLTVTYNSC